MMMIPTETPATPQHPSRMENESDVERREKQPTRDEKGGAMFWHVIN